MRGGSHRALGVSRLPQGTPAGRGVSLDPSIPGTSTFAKPSDEPPREPNKDDESIYRIDNADDLGKKQTTPDENDQSNSKPTYRRPGPHRGPNKTKYPYRDGIPNTHNARLIWRVAHDYLSSIAPERAVDLGLPVKVAARFEDIESGLDSGIKTRAKLCTASLTRADIGNLRWTFSVDCGNGAKTVKLKAVRTGRVTSLSKMAVRFKCSCPAWQWLGPEHHAQQGTYLDGKPRGTATVPVIRDPNGVNRVCKHVASVIGKIRDWKIPMK